MKRRMRQVGTTSEARLLPWAAEVRRLGPQPQTVNTLQPEAWPSAPALRKPLHRDHSFDRQ